MADDPYNICYLRGPVSESDIRDVVLSCSDTEFQFREEVGSIHDYVDAKIDDEDTTFEFRYDEVLEVDLFFNHGEEWDWNDPKLLVSFSTMALDSSVRFQGYTKSHVRNRLEALLELIEAITRSIDPVYAWGMVLRGPSPDEGLRPSERPISESIERLSWITVFSDSLVEDFGGRERVLRTPAWRVEELDTGHVMIVRTDNPVDPAEGPSVSPEAYLLEGKTLDELRADQPRIDDPFRQLDPGDFGADVVMDQADVNGDPTNEDLRLVRCELDHEYRLWELDSGEFVRRVFDEDGDAFHDAATVPSEEYHPPLVHACVPVEFVALDSSDGDNVVTKVMELDVDVDKLRLLVSLASMVEEADDRVRALDTAESILDDAKRAEDVDGIERMLRRLL